MKTPLRAGFLGTGACLPEKVLTNADLEKMVETSDEWIRTRTGIRERRVSSEGEASSDLALGAARAALADAGVQPEELDMILVATTTPDYYFPSVGCLVQRGLGAKKAAAMDLAAACSGFLYGLAAARAFILSGAAKRVLLVGVDTLTKFVNFKDRNTCVLFGDGAGACVLGPVAEREGAEEEGILSCVLGSDGDQAEIIFIPGGGSRHPPANGRLAENPPFIRMDGKKVFEHAVRRMLEASRQALAEAGKKPEDLALFIPHQANLRIIQAIAQRMAVPMEKIFLNVHRYGNISAATTIVALDEAKRQGRLKKGDLVELAAIGAGLTWAAAVIRW